MLMFAMQLLISTQEGISLPGLEGIKARLMTRVESKHVMTLLQCRIFMQALGDSYRVLEIGAPGSGDMQQSSMIRLHFSVTCSTIT